MVETLKAKIRNLLSPSYNLASIIVNVRPDINNMDNVTRKIVLDEAKQSFKSIEEILKLLDNASDSLHITNNYAPINIS